MASAASDNTSGERRAARCPLCDGEIEHGRVSVHGTALGFLFVGLSHQNCWFEGRDKKERIVVGSGERTAGFRCKACGFVGIYQRKPPLFDFGS